MSDSKTIARPYAKAAFNFAVENNVIDQWSSSLTFLAEVVQHENIYQLVIGSSKPEQLIESLQTICEGYIDQSVKNLLMVMAENDRVLLLPDVSELFLEFVQTYQKVADVDVISAQDLSEQDKLSLSSKLEQRLDRKVNLNCSIDNSLIGGVIVKAGDLVIDNSVRSRLDRMSESLLS